MSFILYLQYAEIKTKTMKKEKLLLTIVISILTFLFLWNTLYSQKSKRLELIPGVGFYNLRIGDEIYKVGIILGKPDFKIGDEIGTIYYFSKGIYINYEKNLITHIAVFLKQYKKYTPFEGTIKGGITKNSSKKEIEKVFGKNYEILKGYKGICNWMMIYENPKIVFFLDKNNKPIRAVVFK